MTDKQNSTKPVIHNPPAAEVIALARASRRRTSKPKPFEPCITVKVDGEFRCNCQTFLTNAILFDAGSCPHTRRAALASQLHDLAVMAEPAHNTPEYDTWLYEQERLIEVAL